MKTIHKSKVKNGTNENKVVERQSMRTQKLRTLYETLTEIEHNHRKKNKSKKH